MSDPSVALLKVGDTIQVHPDHDIPAIFRGGKPSEGVVESIGDDGAIVVVVDGKAVQYQALEVVVMPRADA